jgi:hypothetical protein
MAGYVFDTVKLKVLKAEITFDVPDGTYKAALVTSAAFIDFGTGALSDKEFWSEVSGTEITEDSTYNTVGYNGPENINNSGFTEVDVFGFTQQIVSADDISYPVSTIDADGVIIYRNDASGTLINAIHFGQKISSSQGVFNMPFSTDGYIKIK